MLKIAKNLVGLDKVEQVIASYPGQDGAAFTKRMAEALGIKGEIYGQVPDQCQSTVFVSTHHTGGLDFLSTFPQLLLKVSNLKVVLNEKILMVKPLADIAIPAHPMSSGLSNRKAAGDMMEHLKSGGNLLIYPAGKVGHKKDGKVQDSPWAPGLGKVILKTAKQIIPIYVDAQNSDFFYRLRGIFPVLSMLLLLRTVTRSQNVTVPLYLGEAISVEDIQSKDVIELMQHLRNITYSLKDKHI